jgi:hypothetical protein
MGLKIAAATTILSAGNRNDSGLRSRACGSSGANDHDIVCTDWY